jgi:hypothetical protein
MSPASDELALAVEDAANAFLTACNNLNKHLNCIPYEMTRYAMRDLQKVSGGGALQMNEMVLAVEQVEGLAAAEAKLTPTEQEITRRNNIGDVVKLNPPDSAPPAFMSPEDIAALTTGGERDTRPT